MDIYWILKCYYYHNVLVKVAVFPASATARSSQHNGDVESSSLYNNHLCYTLFLLMKTRQINITILLEVFILILSVFSPNAGKYGPE